MYETMNICQRLVRRNYVTETEFQVLLGLVPNYNQIKEMKRKPIYFEKVQIILVLKYDRKATE